MQESVYRKHLTWIQENIERIKQQEEESYKLQKQLIYNLSCNYIFFEAIGKGDFQAD